MKYELHIFVHKNIISLKLVQKPTLKCIYNIWRLYLDYFKLLFIIYSKTISLVDRAQLTYLKHLCTVLFILLPFVVLLLFVKYNNRWHLVRAHQNHCTKRKTNKGCLSKYRIVISIDVNDGKIPLDLWLLSRKYVT